MKQPKPKRGPVNELLRELTREGGRPCTYKGGMGNIIRRQRALMLRAAEVLDRWGRPAEGAREQSDMFKRNAA